MLNLNLPIDDEASKVSPVATGAQRQFGIPISPINDSVSGNWTLNDLTVENH